MILSISRFFSSRHNRLILIQFFVPFWHKPMHHNQSKLLFQSIYSRSIYFISAAFSQSVTTFHLLQQNSKMEKYLIEISFFLFRLVEMFEICSRTSVMATTYCHCSKCSRAKYWYVLFSPVSWHLWQYGLWSFHTGGTKLERFLPKNQHTQRKLMNFENWVNGEVSKIEHHFSK